MRVMLNGLAALKPKTGVGHHVTELHAALQQLDPAHPVSIYPGRWFSHWIGRVNRPSGPPLPPTPKRTSLKSQLVSAGRGAAKMASQLHFAAYTRTFGFDLYHEPNFLPFHSHLPTVVTVHDLSVLKFPQWHPADRVKHHHKHFLRGLSRAQHVIVVSESVRRELIEEIGCPPDRVSTVHNGVGRQFVPQTAEAISHVRRKLDLPEQFFLCVGTIEPRKNLGTVIRAFADLPPQIRTQCPLVLAGPWGWRAEAEREIYERIGRPAGVRYLGYTAAEDLPALYGAARVLLYPSHYEGFGMPPTEMLACGGAVIASTADVLQEVLGECGYYVPTEDVAAWREALYGAATDEEFIENLKQGGLEKAAQFSWLRAAEETQAVYRRVLGLSDRRVRADSTRAAA
jgi:alpha-1,3-rhamnosyl/mannosyltransferase